MDKVMNLSQNKLIKQMGWLILALITVRLISLACYPFFDTTESRYGEIARIMLQTDDWITPQIDYHIPFWGKPPFHTWMSAIGFGYFGINEFAARVPHLIMSILTLGLVAQFVRTLIGSQQAWFSVLVLCSSLGFILASGMVMTDSALLFSYTLAMVSFWFNWQNIKPKLYGHLFFAALGLGMLIKGPVMVVFVGIALVIWSIWQRNFINALKSLPWLTGLLVFAIVTLPWYIAAEIKTPGFIEYFIVGEHISRFLVSGWEGDLYGSAHVRPRGSIWLFAILCAFPWSLVLIKLGWNKFKTKNETNSEAQTCKQPLSYYLICWMIAPLVLFTFAGNILPIYALPGFSAMAILIALHLNPKIKHLGFAAVTLVLLVTLTLALSFNWISPKTQAPLLAPAKSELSKVELYYWQDRPFSAQFYSRGQAQTLNSKTELMAKLSSEQTIYLGVTKKAYNNLASALKLNCEIVNQHNKHMLLRCN